MAWHYIYTGKPQQNGLIENFNDSLRNGCLYEEFFDSLAETRQKLVLLRYDEINGGPDFSLGNKTRVDARRTLELLRAARLAHLPKPITTTIN